MNKKQYIVILGLTLTFSTMGYTANPTTKEYVDTQVTILRSQIAAIPAGTQGPAGPAGPMGSQGSQGETGPGVAAGGVTGQILAKASNDDYDTEWINGGGGTVTYKVGDKAMGGIVFYVDSTGQHGLIAAVEDNYGQASVRWGIAQQTGAFGNGIFAGAANNNLMIARQMVGDITEGGSPDMADSAALVCMNYAVQADGDSSPCPNPGVAGDSCYADWYLEESFQNFV